MILQLQSLIGLIAFPLIAWIISENRGAYSLSTLLRIVIVGILLQVIIAASMLHVPVLRSIFESASSLVIVLQNAMLEGMKVVFGYLAQGPTPFKVEAPQNGFILAFQALPLILLLSAITRLLYYWGLLQKVVSLFSWLLRKSLGISGVVGTSAAANIFVGMVEAPLFVRPYLLRVSRGGLFAIMSVGMATIAGTVLVLYATILSDHIPGVAGHLIVASVISAPAAVVIASLMVPDMGSDDDQEDKSDEPIISDHSSIDAIVNGIQEGIRLLVNVAAMLIVFTALVYLVNTMLGIVTGAIGYKVTIEYLLGFLFAPMAWLTGIQWNEAFTAGSIIGTKIVLNEFLAYLQLLKTTPEMLSDRSRLILTYVLCGFANFASLGIMIGGLASLLPTRRQEIVELGTKSLISGTLATLMTGSVIGLLSGW